jgi:hypothetical protein
MDNQVAVENAINDIAVCINLIERSTERLHKAADIDAPPTLFKSEADFLRRRLGEMRNALATLDAFAVTTGHGGSADR